MPDAPQSQESKKTKWYENQALLIAVLGVAGTIVAAIISVSPQLIAALKPEPTPTAIPATATLEIIPALSPTPTGTITPTTIPPTETLSPTPTETPTPTPLTPPLSCLDRWQVISKAPTTPQPQGGCEKYSYPDLGIEPGRNDILSFGKTAIQIDGLTGIATELSNDVTEISFTVELNNLVDGEFWVALSGDSNPESNSISVRVQPNGLIRVYDTNGTLYTDKTWDELRAGTIYGSGKPYIYNFVFKIAGPNVTIAINDLPLKLTTNPDYLFFGYKNKSSVNPVTIFGSVSKLAIK